MYQQLCSSPGESQIRLHVKVFNCFFPLLNLIEQNESKHDGPPSPGMTDQEKEVAASAYEAFLVIQHLCKRG